MIVGFAKHCKGGGSGPVHYLTQALSPDGSVRTPAPAVVRGDPELVRKLIDALPFERTYTSGVLSFAPGEVITPAMEQDIIDRFEKVAFAGLEPDRYSILWVRHLHAGHHELHFVTPRVELVTGKSLNIHPPGRVSQAMYDHFRSMINAEYGLASPDDPARAQAVSLPNHLAKLRAAEKRRGQEAIKTDIREAITAHVRREVEAGRVQDQAGVVRYLKGAGFEITREGKDYITVLDRDTGKRIRLKGSLFSKERFNARETRAPGVRYGVPDFARAAECAAKLEPMVAARARFHQQRYGVEHRGEAQRERSPGPWHGPGPEPLRAYMARHLGAEALHMPWHPRRQRTRTASQERPGDSGRASDDRAGATVARRVAAFGTALQRAGRHYAAAFADLNRASGRLEYAGGAISAGAAAIEDPWEWLKWLFYGRDREAERWHEGPDIER
jgi:hypothetical protein